MKCGSLLPFIVNWVSFHYFCHFYLQITPLWGAVFILKCFINKLIGSSTSSETVEKQTLNDRHLFAFLSDK